MSATSSLTAMIVAVVVMRGLTGIALAIDAVIMALHGHPVLAGFALVFAPVCVPRINSSRTSSGGAA